MIKNILKIALRNMMNQKFYSFINVFGLTIGLTGAILVYLYVSNELSFDKFHSDHEKMYRVSLIGKIGDQEIHTSSTCPPLSEAMSTKISGVESSLRVWDTGKTGVIQGEFKSTEERFYYSDSNFFEFFDFDLLEGDKSQVLQKPNSIVITEATAKKYFGSENPMGKILELDNEKTPYEVTGICENTPFNSHLQFEGIRSINSLYSEMPQFFTVWLNNTLDTYTKINPQTNIKSVNEELAELVKENAGPTLAQFTGVPFEDFLKNGGKYSYQVYKMTDTRLKTADLMDDGAQKGNITYVYIFSAVGFFILLIACINFMNLSTAKSTSRAKEVGLRKTMGSNRSLLVNQFLAESMIYSIISTVLAVLVAYLLLPGFNQISGVTLTYGLIFHPATIVAIVFICLLVGVLAGSYPAFYLTSFDIVSVLKGKVRTAAKSGKLRSSLVVFQFFLSIVLIISTSIVYDQINFIKNRNLGFDKDKIIIVNGTDRLNNDANAFKNSLTQLPVFTSASYTNNHFPGINNTTVFKTPGDKKDYILGKYFADYDHAETMGFEMAEGRYYSRDFPSDSLAVVINEAAVREIGWENPLNEYLIDNPGDDSERRLKVIGVIKDFNFESLKTKVRPMIIVLTDVSRNLLVKYNSSSTEALATLEKQWKDIAPEDQFEYAFMDQEYDALFRTEQKLGDLFTIMSGVAIFIACVGLFGLASYMAEQRVKEIGIRKSMGATVPGLMKLLSVEFIKLIGIAFLISIYPAYYFMNDWLGEFAFRVDINWLNFVIAGVVAFVLAWLTVSYHAFQAARKNPVDSLKYE